MGLWPDGPLSGREGVESTATTPVSLRPPVCYLPGSFSGAGCRPHLVEALCPTPPGVSHLNSDQAVTNQKSVKGKFRIITKDFRS